MRRRLILVAVLVLPALLAVALAGENAAPASGPKGPWLLVLNKSGDTLAVVDPGTKKVVSTLRTGKGPHEIAVSADGAKAYVANYGTREAPGSTLTVVDLRTMSVSRTINLGEYRSPHGIAVGQDGRIYLTCEGNKAILVVNPETWSVERSFETGQEITHMVAVAPGARRAFAANIGSDTVTVVDLDDGRVTQIAVGKGPEGIDVGRDGKEVWVAHRGDGGLSIFDAGSLQRVKAFEKICGMPIRVMFTFDGRSVLVSCAESNEVLVLDAASREIRKRIPTGEAPIGIVITPDSRTAYVANTRADKVSVLDLVEGKVTGTISPGKEPDGMAWVPAQRN